MRFLLAAILFISAVVVFTLIAKVVYQGSVEAEFERQSVAALKSAGFEGVDVSFDHHEVAMSGFVDHPGDIETARDIVKTAVPVARLEEPELSSIQIQPTIPPELSAETTSDSSAITLSGILGADLESVTALLGSRLSAVSGDQVDHSVEADPKRLPFDQINEFAAIATELVRHSESALISLENGQLTLSGTVPNDGIKEGILELAGILDPESIADEISVVDPRSFLKKSTLTLTRNRFGMTLAGFKAPSDTPLDVAGILKSKSPGLVVNDRRILDENRIAGAWEDHAEEMLPALTEHLHGEMTIDFGENQIRLTGITASVENREAILAAIQPVLNQNSSLEVLADLTVEDPDAEKGPPAFLAVTYVEGLLSLNGRVANDQFVAQVEEDLVAIYPDLLVKNALEVDETTLAAGWIENLSTFLREALPRIEEGSFHFSESEVKLEGTTVKITDKAILQNVAINSVPSAYSVENLLIHPDEPFPMPELLPEARTQLREELKKFPIYFDSNSEIVNETGRDKVEAIAKALKEVGAEVDLIATGFADNVGNAEYNRQLSLRRAAAVVAALEALEIPKDNITTESKGEDVSGLSRSERWKARRVEISLAPDPEEEPESE